MKERFNWFSTAIFCYILFFVFASLPMPASCQPLEFGNNARVHIPVYMDYTDIDDIKSANFRVMWDSTHFDYVDYVRPAYWDSLGFTRVINLQDTSSGLLRLAFAGVNSLEGDSLLFTLVMDTPNDLSVGGFVQVDAMFNEEDFRIKTVDYIIDPTLPVELVDFNATINNNRIFATWTTQSEQNAAGFEVYAISHIWQDDGRWVPSTSYYLGYVAAQGHSTEKNEYAIILTSPIN